ncbi:MAG: DNA-directed RNA polymerase subunit beta, partial [Ruminococcaceae bacterium]|nr:DNA-directed RNA polymerase subunit beta [Oscillospiraceae bacterium]
MPKDVYYGKTLRKSFARSDEIQEMPHLLEVQRDSYRNFLEKGLQEVFRDVAAVTDHSGNLELSFVSYTMNESPKYSEEECKARDATYAAPLKVGVRLRNRETEEIKEQEIFMGDFPLMTESGTFIINGAERVIVSQIVRSPGIYFDKKTDKTNASIYTSQIIPYHGAWLECETDLNDLYFVRIDKTRKLPVTLLLKALGAYKEDKPYTWLSCIPSVNAGCITSDAIRECFGNDRFINTTLDRDTCISRDECLNEIYKKLRPGDPATPETADALLDSFFFDHRRYDISNVGRYKFNKKLSLYPRVAGSWCA